MVDRINPEMTTGDACGGGWVIQVFKLWFIAKLCLLKTIVKKQKFLKSVKSVRIFTWQSAVEWPRMRSVHDAIEYGARKLRYQELKFEQTKDSHRCIFGRQRCACWFDPLDQEKVDLSTLPHLFSISCDMGKERNRVQRVW